MYSTTAYLYQQTQQVMIHDTSGTYYDRSWQKVYTKNLKLSKGTDNVIQIQMLNQDQKPMNISGLEFTCRIMDQSGKQILLAKDLEILNASTGHTKLTVVESDLINIESQPASYSVTVKSGNLTRPVFVDDYAGARCNIDIVDDVFPGFVPSTSITLIDYTINEVVFSSQWNPTHYLQTLQYKTTEFVGSITVQASSSTSTVEWYDVSTVSYNSASNNNFYLNIEGLYAVLRLKIEGTNGTISDILVR